MSKDKETTHSATGSTKEELVAELEKATGKPENPSHKAAIDACEPDEGVLSIVIKPSDGYLSVTYSLIAGPESDMRVRIILSLVQAMASRLLAQFLGDADSKDTVEVPPSDKIH